MTRFGILLTLVFATTALAAIPHQINYQGSLNDTGGSPLDTTVSMTFAIYDSSESGLVLWSETQGSVVVSEGLFNVLLGSVNAIPDSAFAGTNVWLGVTVGADSEMSPREQIASAGYSYRVGTVDGSTGGTIAGDVTLDGSRLEVINTGESVFIGEGAGANDDLSNNRNVFVGYQAGNANTTGDYNTASGNYALNLNTEGYSNTASGYKALTSNTTGYYNTASGYRALTSNTTGHSNSASGYRALYTNTTGNNNTALGYGADVTIGNLSNATAIGFNAQVAASSSLVLGGTGGDAVNVGIGTTSPGATLDVAGHIWQTGTGQSVFIGEGAGANDDLSSNENVFVGYQAGNANTTGSTNTASGYLALQRNTTGNGNTASGAYALSENTTGSNNTASGDFALFLNMWGIGNTALGYGAGVPTGNLNNATAIGFNTLNTASSQVRIGNSSVTSIGGQVGWSTLSDQRFKRGIRDNVAGLDFIMQLHPVTYHMDMDAIEAYYKRPDDEREMDMKAREFLRESRAQKAAIQYSGFIAQEVEQAAQSMGYDFSGVDAPKNGSDHYALRYAEFVVPMVKAMQEQQEMIEELQGMVRELQAKLEGK